ncbi:oligoribonuclease [beta proteobacterium MWH-UniP1]
MTQVNELNMVWVDMEMSGLNPETDRILEVAVIVTDAELNILGVGPVMVVHQPDTVLDAMDAWNKGTHGRSGLIDKVKASTTTESQAAAELLAFLRGYVPAGKAPMCGNTVHQDRRFMARYMPELEAFFHYRNIDVSTIKELCRRWSPAVMKGFEKKGAHTALADIEESIQELRFYRDNWIQKPLPQ